MTRDPILSVLTSLGLAILGASTSAQEVRVPLDKSQVSSSSPQADFSGLVDEQAVAGEPPSGAPKRGWEIPSQFWKHFPYAATLDLGRERNLSALWIYDTNGIGELVVSAGEPGQWQTVCRQETNQYLRWTRLPLDVTTRRLQLEFKSPGAMLTEILLYEYTPEGHRAMQQRKAEAERREAQRAAALRQADAELARQPWTDLPPFGRVRLVDEVDCAAADPGHQFRESPAGVSTVQTILGRPCRVLRPVAEEAAYVAFRLGQWRRLKPGAAYVLALDYPEDQPRSAIVMNGGNETSRGFHTGTTVGDALHAKYVNSNPESLRVPLSGRYETWTLFFHLHDRFPDLGFLRARGAAADGGRRLRRGDRAVRRPPRPDLAGRRRRPPAAVRSRGRTGRGAGGAAAPGPAAAAACAVAGGDGRRGDSKRPGEPAGRQEPAGLVPLQSRSDAAAGNQHVLQGPAGVRRLPALGLDALRRQPVGTLRSRQQGSVGPDRGPDGRAGLRRAALLRICRQQGQSGAGLPAPLQAADARRCLHAHHVGSSRPTRTSPIPTPTPTSRRCSI